MNEKDKYMMFLITYICLMWIAIGFVMWYFSKNAGIVVIAAFAGILVGAWIVYGVNLWLISRKRKHSEKYRMLTIVKDNLHRLIISDRRRSRCLGLCSSIRVLVQEKLLSNYEGDMVTYLIKLNKPAKTNGTYWWPAGEIKPRMKFVKQLIKKYKYEKC